MKRINYIAWGLLLCLPFALLEAAPFRDRKLKQISDLLVNGQNEEAIVLSSNYLKRSKKDSLGDNTAYATTLKAFGLWSDYQFLEAKSTIDALREKVGQSKSSSINLVLSVYFLNTYEVALSSDYIDQAIKGINLSNITRLEADVILQKAKVLMSQGYSTQSLDYLGKIEVYGKRLADGQGELDQDKLYSNKHWNAAYYKERYGEILLTQCQALSAKGDLNEVEKQFDFLKRWISKNIGKSHPLYQKACFEEATVFKAKEKPFNALNDYIEAYLTNERPESDPFKLLALVETLKSYCELGFPVESQNYLRRIQMYAFRNAGVQEPNEFAYQWSSAYKYYWENDLASAKSKIKILEKYFPFLPQNHPNNEAIRSLKAKIAFHEGNFSGYRSQMDTLAIFTAIHIGKETPAYHSKLMEIAKFETLFGKNQLEAKAKIDYSFYKVLKTQIPSTSLQFIEFLDILASNYANQDLYDSATVCQQKVVNGYNSLFGQNNIHYAGALTKLASYQLYHGDYQLAMSNLTTVGVLAPQIKSDAVELVAELYIQMASLEAVLGEIGDSRAHIAKALQFASKETRPSFTNNMENAYQKTISLYATGNYFQAEKELVHDLSQGESTLKKTHPYLNRFYAAHAQLLVENSNYAAAEKAINDALASSQKGTIEQANVLLIQSEYFLAIFDYKSALNAIRMADEIFASKLGKSHLIRSEALIKLADVSAKAKKLNFTEIDKIYNQTTEIIKKSVGTSHPLYAINLERQAEFYIENNKLNEAEKLLTTAKAFWTSLGGENNSNVADILIQLGKIYYLRDNYSEAEKYYSKGKSIYSALFNSNHPGYIRAQSSLARVYYMKGNLKESIDAMSDIVPIYLDYTKKHFPSLSFRQKSKFWNSFKEDFDFYTFLALEKFDRTLPFLRGDVYNMVISTKALLLSSDIKLRKTIASSNDSILIAQFNEWLGKKEVLTQTLALSREDQLSEGVDARVLEADIEKLEKSLSTRSTLFASKERKQVTKWTDIRAVLNEKEVAVEIIRYPIFNKKTTDTIKYVALIIHKGSLIVPELIRIGDGKELESKWLKYYRNSMTYKSNDEFSYNKFWKALKSDIPDGQTIYLSSEGVYNQLNIETITDANGNYILDKNPVVLVTNTRDLVPESTKELPINTNQSVLSGAPEFYSTPGVVAKSIVDLPGAEVEVNTIKTLFESAGAPTEVLYKKEVLEDTIKALKSPRIFHIATHGYFRETTETNDEDPASNPLLNSGLLLAGSGDIIDNKDNSYVNQKPGVLTAQEALDLNFDNTDLVVLSACETGRGSIQVGEGVYGLQRAFLTAGSKAIIISLFKVNDEVTQKLMKVFYQKVLSGQTVRQSFAEAKKQIKAEYPEPIYWGAFILIESSPKAKMGLRSGVGVVRK